MPGFNGTGPQGAGPMTGRARGNCTSPTGYNPGVAGEFRGPDYGAGFGRGSGFRRGFGNGRGRGFGYGRGTGWYLPASEAAAPLAQADETNALRAEVDYLKNSLDAATKRLEELQKKASE